MKYDMDIGLLVKALDFMWDTRWHSWLRHCTTGRKVAGSIPEGVI